MKTKKEKSLQKQYDEQNLNHIEEVFNQPWVIQNCNKLEAMLTDLLIDYIDDFDIIGNDENGSVKCIKLYFYPIEWIEKGNELLKPLMNNIKSTLINEKGDHNIVDFKITMKYYDIALYDFEETCITLYPIYKD